MQRNTYQVSSCGHAKEEIYTTSKGGDGWEFYQRNIPLLNRVRACARESDCETGDIKVKKGKSKKGSKQRAFVYVIYDTCSHALLSITVKRLAYLYRIS